MLPEIRRIFRLLLAVCCCAIFWPASVPADPALTRVRIEVPSATNLQFLALWVALGSGAFQKHGLNPQIIVAPSPRETGQMLLRAEADVTLLPPPMFLGMMAEKKPIRLFASLLANEPINLVLRKEVADQIHFRTGVPLRQKLLALSGLKVGLAPEVAPRLRQIFAAAGLQPDKVLNLVTIPGPQQTKAFVAGTVDLLFAHTPYLETVLVQNGAVLVVDASNGEIAGLTDGQIHALATTPDVMRRSPELIRRTEAAVAAAEHLIHADQKAALAALLASGAVRVDPKLAAATIAVYAPAVPRDPHISVAGIIRDRNLYPAHPMPPDFRVVNVRDFVASEFAP